MTTFSKGKRKYCYYSVTDEKRKHCHYYSITEDKIIYICKYDENVLLWILTLDQQPFYLS